MENPMVFTKKDGTGSIKGVNVSNPKEITKRYFVYFLKMFFSESNLKLYQYDTNTPANNESIRKWVMEKFLMVWPGKLKLLMILKTIHAAIMPITIFSVLFCFWLI
jgi:hypothetical protein